jgi:hypothetical protein
MTKLISILVILVLLWGGWKLLEYWQEVKIERENQWKQEAARVVTPDQLPGMPRELQESLDAAEKDGPEALQNWLKTYSAYLQDPKKAWIELDYCVMIARANPAQAKNIFAAVKQRTPTSSPVWPRIVELQKSYE